MKIALGTVQLGMKYGVSNHSGQTSLREAAKILALARRSGIDTLDTAIAYGESEERLGMIGVEGFQVISKISAFPDEVSDVNDWVLRQVKGSLSRLKLPSLHGLLLHRPEQLLGQRGELLFAAMRSLRDHGLVKQIGVSVYSPSQLDILFDRYTFDIVQAPLNVLDRRIIDSGWAQRLRNLGVGLHTRSVFLQGLLLMPPQERPPYFNPWHRLWKQFDDWVAESGRSALEVCLTFVHSLTWVDKLIVGVENCSQLAEILDAASRANDNFELTIGDVDESLINPALWR